MGNAGGAARIALIGPGRSAAREHLMTDVRIVRLRPGQAEVARNLFAMMARVFDEAAGETPGSAYVERLLSDRNFWALAAFDDEELVGGLTAHTLPMTRSESFEVFIYDLAVRPDAQRRGVGRRLVAEVRAQARAEGIDEVFVPADNDDQHALDFYTAIGGEAAPVTIYSFHGREDET
jgi:aminoglycoside 3-N-acetyltransferase I